MARDEERQRRRDAKDEARGARRRDRDERRRDRDRPEPAPPAPPPAPPPVTPVESTIPLYTPTGTSPLSVDLRGWCTPIQDQGGDGPCSAHAVVSMVEILLAREGRRRELSRLFAHYNARMIEYNGVLSPSTQGSSIESAIDGHVRHGIPSEEIWPYDWRMTNTRPSDAAWADALNHRIGRFTKLPIDPFALIEELARGNPIAFAYGVYGDIKAVGEGNILHTPAPGATMITAHAACLVGYDLERNLFLVRNNYPDMGHQGYHWMTWGWFMNGALASGFWAAAPAETAHYGVSP